MPAWTCHAGGLNRSPKVRRSITPRSRNTSHTGPASGGLAEHHGHPMKLLVVSHVPHYAQAGRLHAYGPYAREIDLWAQIFDHVQIAAVRDRKSAPTSRFRGRRVRTHVAVQPAHNA